MYRLIAALFAFSSLFAHADFEIWVDQGLGHKLNDKWFFTYSSEQRYAKNASRLVEYFFQAGFGYNITPWLALTPQYRQIFERRKSGGDFNPSYAPMLDIKFHGPYRGWYFTNRCRAMYVFTNQLKDFWIYRNLYEMRLPIEVTRLKIRPYLADEFFFRQYVGFAQNRVYIGARAQLNPNTTENIYFLYRNRKTLNGQWLHENILGIEFSFTF
ncbi:MAG: DUF2490 domain-containing protein [Simkaniaceae bacterium]|nr:DUF2490 domain-containing protein [Simkaniaceae bacterium]